MGETKIENYDETSKNMKNLYQKYKEVRNNKKIGRAINNWFTLFVIFVLGIYLYQNREILQRIQEFRILDFFVIIGLYLLNLFILGNFNFVVLKRIDFRVSFSDAILLQYVNNFLNNLISRGGGVYRAIYLKTQYEFPYSKFLSAITGLYVVTFLTNSFFGLVSIQIFSNKIGKNTLILTLIFLGLFLASLSIVIFKPKVRTSSKRFLRILNSIILGWNAIREKPLEILYLILLSILNLLFNSIQLMYIYQILGIEVNWLSMVYLGSLTTITQILTITPSGIGLREAVFAFSSKIILVSDEILVLGSLIIRVLALPSSILAGSISYAVLQKRVKEKEKKVQML